MKGMLLSALLLSALLGLAFALELDAPIVNRELINHVNSNPASSWVAGENERLNGLSVKDFSRLLGVKPTTDSLPLKKQPAVKGIPVTFDARINWPGCIGPVLDQGHCGSCWAFGAIESLQDRFCIQSKGAVNVTLSEQLLVSCDNTNDGCDGGNPITAWQYLKKHGTVTETCYPYAMGSCHHPGCSDWSTPSCNKTCQDGSPFAKNAYYAKSAYTVGTHPTDIQSEILANGPVEVTMAVYEDFANYVSGVYTHTTGSFLGYHAVKNIGWGTTSAGVDYWIIVNSWNTGWGMDGLFYIKRGVNEVGIESGVVAGLAMLPSL